MSFSTLLSPYRRLSPSLWALFAAQVINRLGDFVAPFLSLLLTRRLGLSEADAGLWVTLTALSGIAGILVSGKISDRWGRKPVLACGMALSAALIAVAGFFVGDFWIVWILVAMSFFQGMVRPAIAALIADMTTGGERKDAYALNYLGINIGVAIGPMIAGFLFERDIRALFWVDALSTFAALALVASCIPASAGKAATRAPEAASTPAEPPDRPGADERAQTGSALAAFLARPVLVSFCLLLMVANFVYSQYHFALPLYANGRYGASGAMVFGWLMSCNAIVVVALTPIISHATRRQSPLVSTALGSLAYAVGFGMLALPLSLPLIFVSTVIWTVGEILFSINTGVYLAARTPSNLRGQFQSYREFITNVGHMAGPALGGVIIAGLGMGAVWVIVAFLAVLAAVGFLRLARVERWA